MKRIISLLLSMIIMFSITSEAFAAYTKDMSKAYETGDCMVTYTIQNEWDNYRQIQMSVTNNGSETVRNWALKFDGSGEITNIWNAEVCQNDGEIIALCNSGYNYEIISGNTVEFGFQIRGDDLKLPESVSLCNKTVDSTDSAEIGYEIQNSWDGGFIAEVSVTNNSDVPLEAWRLSFNGNFEITNLWNANKLYAKSGFLVENNVSTTPIAKGETKTFGFQGTIASGETPELSDFVLTSIVVDLNAELPTNPDKPIDPDKPILSEALTILCFGEYSEATNILEIYWKSNINAPVSIYENNDGIGWNKIAEVVDDTAYNYEINENFLIKQIKVAQETKNGVIESAPFIVASIENGVVCTWLDSDNDGIPDYMETIFGADPQNPDTDNDGLSDYDEVYKTGTNPLKYDTDENGVSDADDDKDSDSLSNKAELELGTNPSNPDTDKDGLSDYDEINKYNTVPLNADSDNDTLNDSDEIAIGLDPNNPETFGVPDAEYKLEQTIPANSEALLDINTDEAPYELSLDIHAAGNAKTQLKAKTSSYSKVTDSSARLGDAVDLSYIRGDIDKVKLTYKISEEYLSDNNGEKSENTLDLQGVKRYNIFRFFDEINMLLPVATEYDEESGTVFAETDELGTYCVLDMEVLLRNMDALPDNTNFKTVSRQMYSAAGKLPDETEQLESDDFTSITFIIDIRDISFNYSALNNVKNEIDAFALRAFKHERNCEIRLVVQNSTDFEKPCFEVVDKVSDNGAYTDYESFHSALTTVRNYKDTSEEDIFDGYCIISEALDEVLEKADPNARNYVFDIFAQDKAIYEQSMAARINENAKNNKVHVSFVSEYDGKFEGLPAELVSATNGIALNDFYSFSDTAYDFVWSDGDPIKNEDYYAITATGYNEIKLDSKLYPNGYWKGLNPDADTDQDGITDWDEVITRLLKVTDDGWELPTVSECKDALGTVPFYVQNAFKNESEAIELYGSYLVLPLRSDPTSMDGDEDELPDKTENIWGTNPLKADTDSDGLFDFEEIVNGLDPLSKDSDNDGIPDGKDENPDTYDKSWEDNFVEIGGYYCDFSEGFVLGDFVREPKNWFVVAGQITSSLIPGVDLRDVIANLINGDLVFAGLSAVSLIPVAGDISKAASKVVAFIADNAKNVDNIVGILKFTGKNFPSVLENLKYTDEFVDSLKLLSCKEAVELFSNDKAIQRVLKLATKGDSAYDVIETFKRLDSVDNFKLFRQYVMSADPMTSIIDYEKGYNKLVQGVFGFEDELAKVIAGLDDVKAYRILEMSSKYGDNMLYALKTCGPENIDTIALIIHESKISGKAVTNFLKALSNYGDTLLEVVNKCGVKNVDRLTNFVLHSNGENAAVILDLARKFDSEATTKLLDVVVKVSSKYPDLPAKTIEDYSTIIKSFGRYADDIIDKNTVKEFIGLDEALKHTDKQAICFSPSENGLCAVTVNGTRSYNDTIREVPDDVLHRILNNDGNIAECSQAYDSLSRRAHLSYIEEHYSKAIRDEYEKFVSAIEDARIAARDYPDAPEAIKYLESGIDDDFTFHEGRSIINCAEIWAAREMILHGVKFEDIKLSTRLRNSNVQVNGSIFPPCGNCKNVFWRIRSNVDGYK